jgi:hypothetical protein
MRQSKPQDVLHFVPESNLKKSKAKKKHGAERGFVLFIPHQSVARVSTPEQAPANV